MSEFKQVAGAGPAVLSKSMAKRLAIQRAPKPTCERCKKVVDEVTEVELQVARQTHWEPAEYETQEWCAACVARVEFLNSPEGEWEER